MSVLTDQQKNALNIDLYTVVTANAGSGKTFILTKRFIETILRERIKFKNIVAITFTEKAASELINKISSELDYVIKQTNDTNQFNYLKEFRDYILSAKISTIHSFCFDLIREFPIEAGIDPSTQIIDEIQKEELIKSAVEDELRLLLEGNNQNARDLLRMFGKDNTIHIISKLIYKRYFTDQLIERLYAHGFINYFRIIKELAQEYFLTIYSEKLNEALRLLSLIKDEVTTNKNREEILNGIDNIINGLSSFISAPNFEAFKELIGQVKKIILTEKLEVRKRVFVGADENSNVYKFKEIISEFSDLGDQVDFNEESEKKRYSLIISLIKLYQSSSDRFNYFKALRGVLDFEDLLILADKLLDNEKVKKIISDKYKFILIDEFQDTDLIQINIIRKITNNFDDEHNVFVVGDEKQSIYGFRNAQLKEFQDFKKEISEKYKHTNNSGIVTLSTSFRTTPPIAGFVNYIFSRLFHQTPPIHKNYHQEVEYSELQVGRQKYSEENIVFLVSEKNSDDKENLIQTENVANYILYLKNSDIKIFDRNSDKYREIDFSDIALLFRTRKEIKSYENTFIKKGIPFVVSGGRGYYQSEEIQDWLNYLKFLANPQNDDSLIAILRSPFFALSDNLILSLALIENNSKSYFEKLERYSQKVSSNHPFNEVYKTLSYHVKIASRYSLAELLQKILLDTDYYGKIGWHPKKHQIIANVEKLINVTHKFVSGGLEDLKTFSEYLKQALEKEEAPEAVISEIKNSVQLMTIHQAKGLEFPVVILPNFDNSLQQTESRFGEILINDLFGFCFKIFDNRSQTNIHTLSSLFGTWINQGINYNEQLRILYVALTRATDKLVISFNHNFTKNQEKKFSYKSILLNILPINDFSSNKIFEIQSKLKFIISENEKLKQIEKDYKFNVEIVKDIFVLNQNLECAKEIIQEQKKPEFYFDPITDSQKDEIFTATQLNVFNFCPAKYLLKFVIGYNPYKSYISENEDENEITGSDFGSVFHKLLEKLNDTNLLTAEKLLDEILLHHPDGVKSKFKEEVLQKLNELLNHTNFLGIINHKNSYKEFEIKVKFQNHILLGVIDRINIENDGITIIDYKTDHFDPCDYERKIKDYTIQMEFYALISSIYFNVKQINLILYFINYPDKPFTMLLSENHLNDIRKKFSFIINQIDKKDFSKNISNCEICEYSKDKNCIV